MALMHGVRLFENAIKEIKLVGSVGTGTACKFKTSNGTKLPCDMHRKQQQNYINLEY